MNEINFPKSFIKRMQSHLGNEFELFIEALSHDPEISLRINPNKNVGQFKDEEKIPWCETGRYLQSRPEFIFDPLIHAGGYYVQEASSMLFANAIDFSRDLRVLDLCASPGGKSTLLLSKLSKSSILFSNELVNKRADILKENLVKWGATNVIVTSNRPADYNQFYGYFDVVLVDAPCSGEGMFRKNSNAINEWAENKAFVCSIGQKDILDEAIKLLKRNGLLIYSTCTYSEEENEQITQWFYHKFHSILNPVNLEIEPNWGIQEEHVEHFNGKMQSVYKCYPHKIRGEGMFISLFIVNNQLHHDITRQRKQQKLFRVLSGSELNQLSSFVELSEDFTIRKIDEQVYALPVKYLIEAGLAFTKLNTIKSGTFLGSFNKKNGEFIPSHDLAMSSVIRHDIPFIELDLKNSLYFLKKNELKINDLESLPNGWILARYSGVNLGFLKRTGKRLNNFYPREWAIRKNLPNWK
ncbi:hypothetical protein ACFLRI_00015 [Bacteroidota bacterium]